MKLVSPLRLLDLTLLLVSGYWQGYAQPLQFEHLSVQQGLSNNDVICIYQDREGFMWFGTANGLNRYDGYNFTVFKPDPTDPEHSLQHFQITSIHEDRTGQLWVTTYGGGLNLVDKRTGKITAYGIEPIRIDLSNVFGRIHEDRQGIFWIPANGLVRFDPQTKQMKIYPLPTNRWLTTVREDPSGLLSVGGLSGVYQFNPKTE